jgi:hypothetical protein
LNLPVPPKQEHLYEAMVSQLVHRLKHRTYPAGEVFSPSGQIGKMAFFITKGKAYTTEGVGKKIIVNNGMLGSDFILRYSALSRRYYSCTALSFLEVSTLHQDHFFRCISQVKFESVFSHVRKMCLKLLVMRYALAKNASDQLDKISDPKMSINRKLLEVSVKCPRGARILRMIRSDHLLDENNFQNKYNGIFYERWFPQAKLCDNADSARLKLKTRIKEPSAKTEGKGRAKVTLENLSDRVSILSENQVEILSKLDRMMDSLTNLLQGAGYADDVEC